MGLKKLFKDDIKRIKGEFAYMKTDEFKEEQARKDKEFGEKMDKVENKLKSVGNGMMKFGCLSTILVTLPIISIFIIGPFGVVLTILGIVVLFGIMKK